MSGLSALKFVANKPQQGSSPKHARRQKLSNKLHEQIQMAKAIQAGTEFVPVKIRSVRDQETGETRKVEIPKRLKPWWWPSENGKMFITVRYGARTLEVIEGKNAIEHAKNYLAQSLLAQGTAMQVRTQHAERLRFPWRCQSAKG